MPVLANARHERFAQLVSTGHSFADAYVLAGYQKGEHARKSAARLASNVDIRHRIEELKNSIAAEVVQLEIGKKDARLAGYQERWHLMRTVIKERAADPNMQSAPGGKTGLMVRTMKMIGGGDSAMPVDEFAIDTGLLRELRELEKQAAIEKGEFVETRNLRGDADNPVVVRHEVDEAVAEDLRLLGREFVDGYIEALQSK